MVVPIFRRVSKGGSREVAGGTVYCVNGQIVFIVFFHNTK